MVVVVVGESYSTTMGIRTRCFILVLCAITRRWCFAGITPSLDGIVYKEGRGKVGFFVCIASTIDRYSVLHRRVL